MYKAAVKDGVDEGVVPVIEGKLLLEGVCGVTEKHNRRKAVLGVCEEEGEEAGGANP